MLALLIAAAAATSPGGMTYTAPSGTVRSVASKLSDVVSVKDYCGSTLPANATTCLQAAITAADGKTLDFPFGTYNLTAAINIATTNGIVLRGKGATLATTAQIIFNFSGASSNVTFDGLKFSSSEVSASGTNGLITGIVSTALSNIKIIDCDFTNSTSATNAIKFDLSNVSSSLTGLEVSGSRFTQIGRMGVEIINHTFDDTSRYEQLRIVNNRFDGLGKASAFGQAVSLSGLGKGNVVSGNTISDASTIAIELVGPWTTVVSGNTLRNLVSGTIGISQGKPASAAVKPIGIVIADNTIDGNAGYGMQLTGMNDAVVKGNSVTGTGKVSIETSDFVSVSGNLIDVTNQIQFLTNTHISSSGNLYANRTNTVGYNPDVQSTTLSRFIGDEFLSERSTGLLVDGTSANNTFVGCTFNNEGSPSGGNTLQFNGASVTNNVVLAPNFRRTAAGGTTWGQVGSATGNFIGGGIANTFNPDSVAAAMQLTIGTGTNSWTTPVKLGGSFIYVDNLARLRRKSTAPTSDGDGTAWSPSQTGTITLSVGTGTASVTAGVNCVCTDTTANASVKCAVSASTLTATGTGSDVIAYQCF